MSDKPYPDTPEFHSKLAQECKEFFSVLAKMAQEEAAKNFKYPDGYPADGAEQICPWRKADYLQKVRLAMPEPSHAKGSEIFYLPEPTALKMADILRADADVLNYEPIKTSTLKRILVKERRRVAYWAWSEDGKTPIFPIPL